MKNKEFYSPKKDILEVVNAIKVYENIEGFEFSSVKSFFEGVDVNTMQGIVDGAGKFRNQGVGIYQGSKSCAHSTTC